MKRMPPKALFILKTTLLVSLIILWMTLCWTLAFYLVRRLPWQPAPLLEHLAISGFGFLIFGMTLFLFSQITRKKQHEFFQSILEALRRISKGDFRDDLPMFGNWGDDHLNILVRGINSMASDLGKMEIMRQEFISNVSHEIQSPLTSIQGFARVLKESDLPPAQREHYLDIIEQESMRLSRLSDNMLKLASLDSDKHPFHPQRIRLDKQLQRIILAAEPQWSAKNLELEARMDPISADGDVDLLDQVWINLLHNAVKFTPRGGSIEVSLSSTEEEAVAVFADSGSGIPADSLTHIFERFYKADKSRTRTGGGSGLGLSISRKIVDMHGGRITASNDPDGGAVLTVRIPLQHRGEPEKAMPDKQQQQPQQAGEGAGAAVERLRLIR